MAKQNETSASFYKTLSTETLESMLRDMTLSDSELDLEQLDYILTELKSREPDARTMPPEEALNVFEAEYAGNESAYLDCAYEESEQHPSPAESQPQEPDGPGDAGEEPARSSRKYLRRALLIAAAICLLVLLGAAVCASSPDSAFAQWIDEVFCFGALEPGEYHSLQEPLDDYGIEGSLLPQWLPKRYALADISVTKNDAFLVIDGWYTNEDGSEELSISIIESGPDATTIYEKNDTPIKTCTRNGVTYYVMENTDRSSIVWKNGNCECSITGPLTEEEIEKIIQSIP